METLEWIRFIAGAMFMLIGMFIFVVEMIGVFRFKYVLNRMHAAAMGDTLGIGSCLLGLILMNGLTWGSLKLFFVIVFLWFSSPVGSHLIARLEVITNEDEEAHFTKKYFDKNSNDITEQVMNGVASKETTDKTAIAKNVGDKKEKGRKADK